MNGYLLDSHGLLWWWFEPQRLSPTVAGLLADSRSPVHVSAASIWELSLQCHRGRLPEPTGAYSRAHRNPFDRLLAAQAARKPPLLAALTLNRPLPSPLLWSRAAGSQAGTPLTQASGGVPSPSNNRTDPVVR